MKSIASKAAEIVSSIVEQIKEKFDEISAQILGGEISSIGEAMRRIKAGVVEWGEGYAEMVAETEICASVEEAVLDTYKENKEYNAIYWICEPDACARCQANAEASPVRFDQDFPSGDTVPPAHPRCRCTTSPTRIDDPTGV